MNHDYWICTVETDYYTYGTPNVRGPFATRMLAEEYIAKHDWITDYEIWDRLSAERWLCDQFFIPNVEE